VKRPSFIIAVGAPNALFRGLSDIDKSAVPSVFIFHEQSGGPDTNRHVEVVSASVHHRHFDAAIIVCCDVTRILQPSFLWDGQSIEFGTQHDYRAGAVLKNADHTGAADSSRDVVSEFAKLIRNLGGSLFFVIREFRIAVQVEIKGLDLWIDRIDLSGWSGPGVGGK
jgi:hypothetical protein